ncbi:hypothetical protein SpCBS45565_g02900 [Spizellomyces sp. 'palustris']|nr:hypothetical protein SpCBS45565_g02900 [Spizellomyces sp. 'palustris']
MTTDYFAYLEEYIATIEAVPQEVHYTLNELRAKDEECDALRQDIARAQMDFYDKMEEIVRAQVELAKLEGKGPSRSKPKGKTVIQTPPMLEHTFDSFEDAERKELVRDFPDQLELYERITEDFNKCKEIAEEKVQMAERSKELIDRYLRRLSQDLDRINPSAEESSECATVSVVTAGHALRGRTTPINSNRNTTSVFSLTATGPSARVGAPTIKRRALASQRRSTKRKSTPHIFNSPLSSPRWRGASPDTSDELVYCTCQQVSFGEMIACDNEVRGTTTTYAVDRTGV